MTDNKGGNTSLGCMLWLAVLAFAFITLVLPAFYDAFSPYSERNNPTSEPEQIIALYKTPTPKPTNTPQPTPEPTVTQTSDEEDQLADVNVYVFQTRDGSQRLASAGIPLINEGERLVLRIFFLTKEELEDLDKIPFWNYEKYDVMTYDKLLRIRDIQRAVYIDHDLYLFGRVVRGDDVEANTEFEFEEDEILNEYSQDNSYLVFFIEPDSEEKGLILGGICDEDYEIYGNDLYDMLDFWIKEEYDPNNIETLIDFFTQIQEYLDSLTEKS